MKARIKHTQQIIDVEWNFRGWIWDGPNGKRLFDAEELDFCDSDNIDWQSFRAEAAKDILVGMMSHPRIVYGSNTATLSRYAIEYADELIMKLKEQK